MAIADIISQLQRDEGFRANVYVDTVGKRTCGFGHNLNANPLSDLTFPITETQATQILGKDVECISRLLMQALPWIVSLDEARLGVLQNMSFNMGVVGLLEFQQMLKAMEIEDWATAKIQGEDSRWYTQVGDRAVRLMTQLETGVWQ
jgi:lysozyme